AFMSHKSNFSIFIQFPNDGTLNRKAYCCEVSMGNNSITYAIYNPKWKYGTDERLLKISGQQITPEDYEHHMHGFIYCPECYTPLSRNPAKKRLSKNAKTPHFRHLPTFKDVPCLYHTIQQAGLNYVNDELTSETEEDDQFRNIKEWAKLPPDQYMKASSQVVYQGVNHDPDGEKTEVPLPRHTGDKVKRGSKIETVQYICWHLDDLFNVGFTLPGKQVRLALKDLLYNVKFIKRGISEEPQLFFGKMTGFHHQIFRNRSKIQCNDKQFMYLYTYGEHDERRNYDATCIGQYIMFFGSVRWGDDGKPYVMLDDWGTYAVIPRKFEALLRLVPSYY
ncbi:hypothetical protein ACYVOZ_003506, partial [Vibrio cholerae]